MSERDLKKIQAKAIEEGIPYQSLISIYDPASFQLEMYKVTPEHTVAKLEISLSSSDDNSTAARICYEFTALGQKGEEFLREFTADCYEKFMVDWENAMNHYLTKGKKLS
jgi:hypothetical protein